MCFAPLRERQRPGRSEDCRGSVAPPPRPSTLSRAPAPPPLAPSPRLQQNEIVRENSFFGWSPRATNAAGLVVMALAFPLGFHYLQKGELERRDVALRRLPAPREYL